MFECRDDQERRPDKGKMTDFHSGAEEAESKWDVSSGQSRRTESTCKPKAVKQAERESYQPWFALRQSVWIRILSEYFPCNKQNAKRDDCFNRGGRHVHEAQRRES